MAKEIITNGDTSRIERVFLPDSSSLIGAGLTGLGIASSGLIISTITDNEATPVVYTAAGSTIETIATLGTYAAPTATKCRFKEVDATNHSGLYELQFADARYAVANAEKLIITISGAVDLAPTFAELQLGVNVNVISAVASFFQDWFTVDSGEVSGSEVSGSAILEIAKIVWDRILTGATHNIATSAGRRLRGIQEFQGYENGAIWIDTINGATGTVPFENGTVENPVDNIADAYTLSADAQVKINRFQIANGSSITLAANSDTKEFLGSRWTLALGGQSLSASFIRGAAVTGICTGATKPHFEHCDFGAVTMPPSRINDSSGFSGTFTVGSAGDFDFIDCNSLVPGAPTPTFDLGSGVGASNFNIRDWKGGLTFLNIEAGDVISLEGIGGLPTINGSGGSIDIRGIFEPAVDNSSAAVTIVQKASMNRASLVGYDGGNVFIDTLAGTAGTLDFVNGTADNPVDSLADARTIMASIGLTGIHLLSGSSIILASDSSFLSISGRQYSIALGGQNIEGTSFDGANSITGIGTGGALTDPPLFRFCALGDCTLPPFGGFELALFGTITFSSVGAYTLGGTATILGATATFDYGALLNASTLSLPSWGGGPIEIQNTGAGTGTYEFDMNGWGDLTINANCSATTVVNLRGAIGLINNGTGITINDDLRIDVTQISTAVWTTPSIRTLTATGLDLILIDGKTLPIATQLIAAMTAGKISGAGTGTETIIGIDGVTTRITATVDPSGNRTAMVYP